MNLVFTVNSLTENVHMAHSMTAGTEDADVAKK